MKNFEEIYSKVINLTKEEEANPKVVKELITEFKKVLDSVHEQHEDLDLYKFHIDSINSWDLEADKEDLFNANSLLYDIVSAVKEGGYLNT